MKRRKADWRKTIRATAEPQYKKGSHYGGSFIAHPVYLPRNLSMNTRLTGNGICAIPHRKPDEPLAFAAMNRQQSFRSPSVPCLPYALPRSPSLRKRTRKDNTRRQRALHTLPAACGAAVHASPL